MPATTLISQAAYARRRGVDPTSVRDAVRAGRITLVDGKVDPGAADAQWERNTRTRTRAVDERPAPSPPPPRKETAPSAEVQRDEPPQIQVPADYQDARARREQAEAGLAELKLREQAGELIRMQAVRDQLALDFATTRESLMQIPARLGPMLAAESDPAAVHRMLATEIHQSLLRLAGVADAVTQGAG